MRCVTLTQPPHPHSVCRVRCTGPSLLGMGAGSWPLGFRLLLSTCGVVGCLYLGHFDHLSDPISWSRSLLAFSPIAGPSLRHPGGPGRQAACHLHRQGVQLHMALLVSLPQSPMAFHLLPLLISHSASPQCAPLLSCGGEGVLTAPMQPVCCAGSGIAAYGHMGIPFLVAER